MGIIVTKAGWQTMVMDQGRRFTRHLGVPASGAIDLFQYWWANGMVDKWNFQDAGPPVLEIRSGPVEIVFEDSHVFALAGSSGQFYLNGTKIPGYQRLVAEKNQTLRIKNIQRNGTVYLAIGGEWSVDRIYGSASADILSPFPGTTGNFLKNNDRIKILQATDGLEATEYTPEYIKRFYEQFNPVLRLTAGPELNLSDQIKKSLLEDEFVISRKSNRMAYRLDSTTESDQHLPSMVSSIVLPGMIQWPSQNQPILLLPNCQTTGGYPRVAKVIDADMWKLAYAGPGDSLRFKWVPYEEALYLRNYEMGQFTQAWNQTFRQPITNHSLMY